MPRYRNATARRSHIRVTLALYLLADDAGLFCKATNAEIARQAGLAVDTTKGYLHAMEYEGVIATFDPGPSGSRRRTIVLMDHPDAGRAVAALEREGRAHGLHTGIAWGVYPDGSCGDDEMF